jgi:purine-binding chemotaxis protein CheW
MQESAVKNTLQSGNAKYLTFALGAESYAIPVLKVREIIKLAPITVVPQMPDYIKGVINLRGKIIPVVDLRLKLFLAVAENTDRTCIIVVQVSRTGGGQVQMGLIVDGVEEVVNIQPSELEPTPDFGAQVDSTYIVAMAKIKGSVKALLDIDRVVGIQELQAAEAGL